MKKSALVLGTIAIAAASFVTSSALAEEAPTGIVDNPCLGVPVMPASVKPYFKALLDGQTPSAPPAEFAAYKAAMDKAKQRDWANLCYYRADNARLAGLPPRERTIVYMGDSLTELWGVADPAFFTGGRVNRGISGQTTSQMLARFPADVIALHPRVVHILAGTNDIAGNTGPQTMQDVRNNIMAMASLAKANGIRVVLVSLPPTLAFPWSPGIKPGPQIAALNLWLKDYARRIGATYVDYYAPLATPAGEMRKMLTLEGVHINSAGYRVIAGPSRAATDAKLPTQRHHD